MTNDIRNEAHPSHRCPACIEYAERRMNVVLPEVVTVATVRDLDPKDLLGRYMRRIHDRHSAGLSLGRAA